MMERLQESWPPIAALLGFCMALLGIVAIQGGYNLVGFPLIFGPGVWLGYSFGKVAGRREARQSRNRQRDAETQS